MARSGHYVQLYGVRAVAVGWLILQPLSVKTIIGFLFVGVFFLTIFKAARRDIEKAAARIRELEYQINTLAGEDLLMWETKWGGAVTGYFFRHRDSGLPQERVSMDHLQGIYQLLRLSPTWLTFAALYAFCIALIPLGRRIFEGAAYNVAMSSKWGDVALICCVLIAATVLKRQMIEARWLEGPTFQVTCIVLALLMGVGAQLRSMAEHSWKIGPLMDAYHNALIVPFLLFLLASTLPVVYLRGTVIEKGTVLVLLTLWAALLLYDINTGRLDQRRWLQQNGHELF